MATQYLSRRGNKSIVPLCYYIDLRVKMNTLFFLILPLKSSTSLAGDSCSETVIIKSSLHLHCINNLCFRTVLGKKSFSQLIWSQTLSLSICSLADNWNRFSLFSVNNLTGVPASTKYWWIFISWGEQNVPRTAWLMGRVHSKAPQHGPVLDRWDSLPVTQQFNFHQLIKYSCVWLMQQRAE